jgi:glucokinase
MVGAVDVGGTKIAVGMVNSAGKLLARFESPTQGNGRYEDAIDRTAEMLRTAVGRMEGPLEGIGIGSTGPVDPLTGRIGNVNFFPEWEGQNPVEDLNKRFGVSVAMENDADAAALGEAIWGSGKNKSRLIYVTVGTGIGVAIILDGNVYRGVGHSHPEIGHHVIDASAGTSCMCGFSGCWEALAAGPAMVNWIERNAPQEFRHRAELSAKGICELARRGDEWAQRAVEREARYLGLGLANLVTIFVPDVIVLSGSVMKSSDLFLPTIRKVIASSCGFVPHEKTELVSASLGEDANLIGAGSVWYHRFRSGGGNSAG